jgi:Tfp pilus assembly protein PilF
MTYSSPFADLVLGSTPPLDDAIEEMRRQARAGRQLAEKYGREGRTQQATECYRVVAAYEHCLSLLGREP